MLSIFPQLSPKSLVRRKTILKRTEKALRIMAPNFCFPTDKIDGQWSQSGVLQVSVWIQRIILLKNQCILGIISFKKKLSAILIYTPITCRQK